MLRGGEVWCRRVGLILVIVFVGLIFERHGDGLGLLLCVAKRGSLLLGVCAGI